MSQRMLDRVNSRLRPPNPHQIKHCLNAAPRGGLPIVVSAVCLAAFVNLAHAHDYQTSHKFKIGTQGDAVPEVRFIYRATAYAKTDPDCVADPEPKVGNDPIPPGNPIGDWIAARYAEAPASIGSSMAIAGITELAVGKCSGRVEVAGDVHPSATGCVDPPPPHAVGVARAGSYSRVKVIGKKLDKKGNIVDSGDFEYTRPEEGGRDRNVIRDPIVARLIDLTTGVTTEWTLMSLMISIGDGQVAWQNDVLSSTSHNITLDLKIDSPVTLQQGRLRLAVVGGIVTERICTGMFAGMPLPAMGASGGFSIPLPEISLDYDLGGDSTHDLVPEFEFDEGGELQKEAHSDYIGGSLITDIGTGYNGSNVSAVPVGDSTFGFGANSDQLRIADDFNVASGSTWTLHGLIWPLYQTNSAPDAPLTAAYVQLWRDYPGGGGVLVAGDMVTNRLLDTRFTDMYRVSADPTLSTRAIKDAYIDMSWAPPLGDGHYWLVLAAQGQPGFTGPWAPAAVWASSSDNAMQYNIATNQWYPLTDSGSQRTVDFPFRLLGSKQSSCPADIAGGSGSGDGVVNTADLLKVISNWAATDGTADVNQDGVVNSADLLMVVNSWGSCPVVTGACCLPNGQCAIQTEMLCLDLAGGTYHGDNTNCGSINCPILPANDSCPNAMYAVNGTNWWSNAYANTDGPAACAAATRDVWFNYTATCTGTLTINTLGTYPPFVDTVLQVFNGYGCNPLGPMLACNDDIDNFGGNLLSSVSLPVTTGQQLKIRCASWGGDPYNQGPAYLNISCQYP